MNRSPIALALVAALGAGTALPSAPALAQQGASMTVVPIRTGSSSIGGAFGVRLSVYDARSFELFWNRIPNAATYRLQVGSRTVQENGAVSRYVSGVSLAGGFDYTLTALDRSGTALATQRFRVQPASGTQLAAVGGGTSAPTAPTQGPERPRDTPQAPMGLRGRLYSPSAGEVFWDRIPGAILSYEVSLGGRVVATTNGTSHFVGDRPGLSGTRVEVVAIGSNGRRSSASSVTLGDGASNPAVPTNPATGPIRTGISTIGGDFPVRLAVYDAQSFELSWQRVPGAATYRLSRGGQVVQRSDGLSRYVSGIDGSASFAYTLAALDASGTALRSTSFTVSPRGTTQLVAGGGTGTPTAPTNPGAGDSTLPDAVARRLERALSLYRGDPIELAAAVVERFDAPGSGVVETSRMPADPAFANSTGTAVDYACGNGGTASSRDTADGSGLVRRRDITFSNCRVGALTVTGAARRGANPVPADIALPAPFTAADLEPFYPNLESLRIVDSRDGSEIALGRGAQAFTNFSSRPETVGLLNRNWAANSEPARLVDAAGRVTVAAIAVGISYRDDGTGQIGTVDQYGGVTLSGDGADALRSIGTPVSLERDVADARYTAGTLEIVGEGFRYVLDAGNGDPATFQLTVEANGTTSSYTVAWSERFDIDAFLPAGVDLGFDD